MTSRKAVIAMAMLVPILLGVSTLGYASMAASGANPLDNGNNSFGNPHCVTTVTQENVGGNAVQAAINGASPGAVICVAAGVYPEQLSITQSLTLIGLGNGHNPTEIQPTAVVQNSADPDTSTPEYNIILVGGGTSVTGVTISNLVVDGSKASSTFTSCADDYEGILFLNAGGVITGNTVQNVYLPTSLGGCQPGDAIEVQTGTGSSSVTISNNQALNYNKNGITCNDKGTTCNINQNTVSWSSAFSAVYSPLIAPNGIQIGYGAVGKVTDNTVSGNTCTDAAAPCGPNLITQTQSAGILTYQSGAGTVVSGNTLKGNDIGIALVCDAVTADQNTIQSSTAAGIVLQDGTYQVTDNSVSTSPVGIAMFADGSPAPCVGSAGATLRGNGLSHVTQAGMVVTTAPGTFAMTSDGGFSQTVTGTSVVNIASFGGQNNQFGQH